MIQFCWCSRFRRDFHFGFSKYQTQGFLIIKQPNMLCNIVLLLPEHIQIVYYRCMSQYVLNHKTTENWKWSLCLSCENYIKQNTQKHFSDEAVVLKNSLVLNGWSYVIIGSLSLAKYVPYSILYWHHVGSSTADNTVVRQQFKLCWRQWSIKGKKKNPDRWN